MKEILQSLGFSTELFTSDRLINVAALIGGELLAVWLAAVVIILIIGFIVQRLKQLAKSDVIRQRLNRFQHLSRTLVIVVAFLLCFAVIGFNGWLVFKGVDPLSRTLELLKSVPPAFWLNLGIAFAKVIVAFYVARFLVRTVTQLLTKAETKVSALGQIHANNESISAFFSGLNNVFNKVLWFLLAIFASKTLGLPASVYGFLLKLVTIYLIIGIGLIVVRTVNVIVETLDALSAKVAEGKNWHSYYDALRPLIPLFRRCLEAVIWLVTATLALKQLDSVSQLAVYGPRLIQAIGIFFIARVGIELGHLIIDQQMTQRANFDEVTLKRRVTIAPLFKSVFRQICYFIALVVILGALGIDIMPFLAGAGILGVVIGLGAQPMINDVVSGFFILFENMFMMDDYVQINGHKGVIEAVDFRTTRLRDPDGNLHIIRNGEMRDVKSYSKGYTFAVVEIRVAYENDLSQIENLLGLVSDQIKQALPHLVTGPLDIKGITEFGESALHIRTVTPVVPAEHFTVATKLRELIKRQFDLAGIEVAYEKRIIVSKIAKAEGGS